MESSNSVGRDSLAVAILVGLSAGIAYVVSGDISRTIATSVAALTLFLITRILLGLGLHSDRARGQAAEAQTTPNNPPDTPERLFTQLRMDVPPDMELSFMQCWEAWMNWTATTAVGTSGPITLLRTTDNNHLYYTVLAWEKAEVLEHWTVQATNLKYQAALRSLGVSVEFLQLSLARSIATPTKTHI